VGEAIREGYDGIMIGHGTDTMHHTSAVLSFMVQRPPVPIIMVGSQRSSDRPSSDAAQNLINAAYAAGHGPIAEVLVCMFGPTSDVYNLLHRGTRVRKMHSSVRSTFRTLGDIPVAMVEKGRVTPLHDEWAPRRDDRDVTVQAAFDDHVTLLYYYPGMQPDIIDALVDRGYRGIVIAGTGLGHVNRLIYPALERANARGRPPLHDAADAVGIRADAGLRDGPRDPGARRRAAGQHAARGGVREAGLGAGRASGRPGGRPPADDGRTSPAR
jgi:glutamyl-tRNA(Gln) amidotransferase subunit D